MYEVDIVMISKFAKDKLIFDGVEEIASGDDASLHCAARLMHMG